MNIKKSDGQMVCEMGECRNIADYAICFDNLSPHSNIYFCAGCGVKLSGQLRKVVKEQTKNARASK